MHILNEGERQEWLSHNTDWSLQGNEISASYKFKNFVEAVGFMTMIAIEIERKNHHPTIINMYNKVQISMTTHDAGNVITNKDTDLAEIISKLKR